MRVLDETRCSSYSETRRNLLSLKPQKAYLLPDFHDFEVHHRNRRNEQLVPILICIIYM